MCSLQFLSHLGLSDQRKQLLSVHASIESPFILTILTYVYAASECAFCTICTKLVQVKQKLQCSYSETKVTETPLVPLFPLAKFPVQFLLSPPPLLSALTAEFASPHGEVSSSRQG